MNIEIRIQGLLSRMSLAENLGQMQQIHGCADGESGRLRAEKGTYCGAFHGADGRSEPVIARPPPPPGIEAGHHGGSSGYLTCEFIEAILMNRKKIPHYKLQAARNQTAIE